MTNGTGHIALVGHCRPDAFALRSAAGSLIPGAEVSMVADEAGLRAAVESADLLLVNRVLDGAFETESGIELIRILSAAEGGPALMLVSNFAEAQTEAEAAGALPGFGKREMYAEETAQKLRDALGASVD